MHIGSLGTQTGLAPSRVRCDESQVLLRTVQRTLNDLRSDGPEAGYVLRGIASAHDARSSLDAIGKFLPQAGGGWNRSCLAERVATRLADIAVVQARLTRTYSDIEALLVRLEGEPDEHCRNGVAPLTAGREA